MGKDKKEKKDKDKDKEKTPKGQLPEHLQIRRDYVICKPDLNQNVNTVTSANAYRAMGVDNSWNFQEFKENFQIVINKLTEDTIEFDMIGADPAIANALRRVLIAEVPTVAIEHVFVANNTSIIQDEVLAHRLGLVPLFVNPDLLDFKVAEEAASEKNTLVFRMEVKCIRRPDGSMENDKVLSESLVWLPNGSLMPRETACLFAKDGGQAHLFPDASTAPRPVHSDILLAKLRPGQAILLEAHATKGLGKDHAKWSPVATAWYRLQPEVALLKEVPASSEVAQQLLSECEGLFVVAGGKLQVTQARGNERVLEKLRRLLEQEAVADAVQYRKRKDHFIFTIESTGVLPPEELLTRALDILHEKARGLAEKL